MAELTGELDAEVVAGEAGESPTNFWDRFLSLVKSGPPSRTAVQPDPLRETKTTVGIGPAETPDEVESQSRERELLAEMKPCLLRVENDKVIESFAIEKLPLKIGRSSSCELIFRDHSISRHHARVFMQEGSLLLLDENSSNGCFVNGKRTKLHRLVPGDMVQLGGVHLVFECGVAGAEEERTPEPSADESNEEAS